jgi:hypothetical protein
VSIRLALDLDQNSSFNNLIGLGIADEKNFTPGIVPFGGLA